jgi:RNA polymerase sigma-70 factor (ECF subfamily)
MESLSTADEAKLVMLARGDDRDAFGELVRRHQTRAYNTAYRLTGNRADALDVTQDAFVRAYDALGSFDRARPFAPWLNAIVTNLALNLLQRRKPVAALDEARPLDSVTGDPETNALKGEEQRRVGAALLQLPPAWRAVIELRHFQELSYDEIAQVLELPPSDVKSHLFRGRARLREILEATE